jgi:N-acetylglutamate synthase-like GNAT family acetyltransferase
MIEPFFHLRQATPSDVHSISQLVQVHAQDGQILPRSREAIRESIPNWFVITNGARIVACGSLHPYTSNLAEIRSLVVDDSVKRNGLGTLLVQALISKAHQNGFKALFALTRVVPFFEQLGFSRTDKSTFPQKIWLDCSCCPRQENCDEQAVALPLSDHNAESYSSTLQIKGGRYASVRSK